MRLPAAALGASAVLYSSWLLAPWLNPRLGLTTGLASDLAATDQPYHQLFRVADLAAGSLALAGSARMLLRGGRTWAERAAWLGAGVFGLATIFDASLTALSCAPSIDPNCTELSGDLPAVAFDPHTLTSVFAAAGGVGSAVAFWVAARPGTADRAWAGALSVASLAVNAGLLVELVREGSQEALWQRAELATLGAWLVYAANQAHRCGRYT